MEKWEFWAMVDQNSDSQCVHDHRVPTGRQHRIVVYGSAQKTLPYGHDYQPMNYLPVNCSPTGNDDVDAVIADHSDYSIDFHVPVSELRNDDAVPFVWRVEYVPQSPPPPLPVPDGRDANDAYDAYDYRNADGSS